MKQDTLVRDDRGAATARRRGRVVSIVLFAVVVVLGTAVAAWAFRYGGRDVLADMTTQTPADTEAVEGLDLAVPVDYFTNRFGPARSVVDACTLAPCTPEQAGLTLSVHESQDVVVRALTQGDALQAYLLTVTSDEYHPTVRWLGRPIGTLGRSTAAEVLDAMGPSVRPGDTVVSATPPTWVDVVPVGAPGNHRGVILAWTPQGAPGVFDADAAAELAGLGPAEWPLETVDRLRLGTSPNTAGHYIDRGPVGDWLHDADAVAALLSVEAGA